MHNQVIKYVCDRCGRNSEQSQGKAPSGWTQVEVTPLNEITIAHPERMPVSQAELCDGCSTQIRRYMQPVDQPDNSADHRRTDDNRITGGAGLTEVQS